MDQKLLYSRYEFEDLVKILQDRLTVKETWKDTYASSTGQTLIELYAYLVDLLLYYLERRTEEGYINTAKNRSSVLNLVSLLNYKPKRNISAIGTVRFTANKAVLSPVIIPEKTVLATNTGIEFVTVSPAVINTGYTQSTEVKAIQGSIKEMLREAPGIPSYEIHIESTKVENNSYPEFSSISVLVDGERWSPVNSFLFSSSIDKHFTVKHNLDDTISVVFGDGKRGLYPAKGSLIKIEYLESDGLKGNIYLTGVLTTIKSFSSLTYEYLDNGILKEDTINLTVTNLSQMIGGDDLETTDEIRQEAPNIFKIGNRLVTREDFLSFLYNYPQIAEAVVLGENELSKGTPSFMYFNVVQISALLKGWVVIPEQLQQQIAKDLYKKSLMTVKYEFVEPIIYKVIPTISAKIDKRFSLSYAQSSIRNTINKFFILGDTAKFGEAKRLSNLVEAVDKLEEVKYLYMYLDLYDTMSQPSVTSDNTYRYYTFSNIATTAKPLKKGTIKIYGTLNDGSVLLLAIDNSAGSFQVANTSVPFSISSSSINYTNGTFSVVFRISKSATQAISSGYTRYQQDVLGYPGDIVVDQFGICKLETIDFVSLSYE